MMELLFYIMATASSVWLAYLLGTKARFRRWEAIVTQVLFLFIVYGLFYGGK